SSHLISTGTAAYGPWRGNETAVVLARTWLPAGGDQVGEQVVPAPPIGRDPGALPGLEQLRAQHAPAGSRGGVLGGDVLEDLLGTDDVRILQPERRAALGGRANGAGGAQLGEPGQGVGGDCEDGAPHGIAAHDLAAVEGPQHGIELAPGAQGERGHHSRDVLSLMGAEYPCDLRGSGGLPGTGVEEALGEDAGTCEVSLRHGRSVLRGSVDRAGTLADRDRVRAPAARPRPTLDGVLTSGSESSHAPSSPSPCPPDPARTRTGTGSVSRTRTGSGLFADRSSRRPVRRPCRPAGRVRDARRR